MLGSFRKSFWDAMSGESRSKSILDKNIESPQLFGTASARASYIPFSASYEGTTFLDNNGERKIMRDNFGESFIDAIFSDLERKRVSEEKYRDRKVMSDSFGGSFLNAIFGELGRKCFWTNR